jgi:putative DNA primase/helicase
LTLVPKPTAPVSPEPEPEPDTWALEVAARLVAAMTPIAGTPGEEYLRDVRCIDVTAIADVLARADAIGWHPGVWFHEPGHPLHDRAIPAIICVMTDAVTGAPTGAISRTYIHAGRKIGKAKGLGSPAGIVRLTSDEDVLSGLHIAEGLETALAAMSLGFRPMWSTGSTVLMASFPVLDGIEALTILADHDANGAGEKAAQSVATRWRAAGKEVSTLVPDEPGDFNDTIMRLAA